MQPQLPTLGVVAIARNEEQDLPPFLDHLLPWVDEIILVDDASTDCTVEIARAAGLKVRLISSPRSPGEHYSHQRNKGIQAATSDWLLHMDIDERVTPKLAREILRAIRNPAKDGYRFRRLNFFLHRPMQGGGWETWNLIHLARREKFRFGGKMHETCLLDAPADRIGQLHNRMWHLNDADYLERLNKNTAYLQVQAQDWIEAGFKTHWFDFLIRPPYYFVKPYLFQGGWRDGMPGLIWALHCATGAVRLLALIWDAQHEVNRHQLEIDLQQAWRENPLQPTSSSSPVPTAQTLPWTERLEGKLRCRLSHWGERLGIDWLVYNPLAMRYYHKLALREAPGFVASLRSLFPQARRYADVGSGTGAYAAEALRQGIPTVALERNWFGRWMTRRQGVEGHPFNLSRPQQWKPPKVDLAYSIEVAEHLPPELGKRLVQFLCDISDQIVFTAAPPGQEGTGHINPQPQPYWIEAFSQHGFRHNPSQTTQLANLLQQNGAQAKWLVRNVMVFHRHSQPNSQTAAARPGSEPADDPGWIAAASLCPAHD